MENMIGLPWFDWEVIAECQYPIPTLGPEYEDACSEPASYKAIWGYDGEDFIESMNVCKEHFIVVQKEQEVDS